jgi:hypothetical protein
MTSIVLISGAAMAQEPDQLTDPGPSVPPTPTEGGPVEPQLKEESTLPQGPTKAKDVPEKQRSITAYGGPTVEAEDQWKFSYNGYFRAPLRVGMGKRDIAYAGQSETTFHAPLIPDDQYLSWQSTKHNRRDWAELFFSYGNSWAKGVVAIQGFNFTDASAYQNGSQFGIGQGWLELTPALPWENLRLKAKIGSFWNRYGNMGQWDSGEYDTYLFGRTHVMGETVRLEYDFADQPITIGIEDGVGAKRPDAQVYNSGRFTMLHHLHTDLAWDNRITLGLHFLHAFTAEEARFTGPQQGWVSPSEYVSPYQSVTQPDGRMLVFGGEARFDMPDVFGYLYLGASYVDLKDAVTVAPAIEVIHSYGGGEFNMGVTGNYLDSESCRWQLSGATCSGGNGNVMTLAGQYVGKIGDLLGESPFGDGQDLTVKLYGMFNRVKSKDPLNDGIQKVKFGTDVQFDAFDALAFATRFDYLAPNSRIKNQNFMILSPRLVFRTHLVTHEQVALQYSHYFYAKRECDVGTPADIQRNQAATAAPGVTDWQFAASAEETNCVQPPSSAVTPDGWAASTENQDLRMRGMPITGVHLRPDVNVVSLEASMWW